MTKHATLFKLLGIGWLSAWLAACNMYHLRGEADMPEIMRHIYLQTASPQLHASFKDSMRAAGAKLSEAPDAKGVIIHVLNERFDRRTLSLSSTGKSNEFQLLYVLDYEVLTHDGKAVMPRQNVQVNRDYFNDQQAIMGKGNEETLIRTEMYTQAVRSILDRGRALLSPKKP